MSSVFVVRSLFVFYFDKLSSSSVSLFNNYTIYIVSVFGMCLHLDDLAFKLLSQPDGSDGP